MAQHDLIIIGGGISGLSLAFHALRGGLRPCLLEKEARVGGALATHGTEDGFWLELGAHTAYNSYGGLLEILSDRELMERLTPRETSKWMLWDQGRAVTIPSRLNFLELAFSLPRMFWTPKQGATVEGYYARLMGAGNYRRVGRAMFNAVTSQDAGEIPAALLFKKRERDKNVLKSYTLPGGLGEIPRALERMEGLALHTGCTVTAVRHGDGGFQVDTPEAGTVEAPALALALAPDAAAGVLREAFPQVAAHLERMQVVDIATIGVVVRKDQVALPPMAGLVGGDEVFFSAVTRDTVDHPDYRGFAFHCRPGTSLDAGLDAIAAVLGLPRDGFAHTVSRRNRLPALRLGHPQWVEELDRLLAGHRLLVTGNFFGGLAIEDCITRSRAEASRLAGLAS